MTPNTPATNAHCHESARSADGQIVRWLSWMLALAIPCLLLLDANEIPVESDSEAALRSGAVATRLNPNIATAAELTALPGIGPTKADRIVAFRRDARVSADADHAIGDATHATADAGHGTEDSGHETRDADREKVGTDHAKTDSDDATPVYNKPDDLLAVRGIGPKTVARIRAFLTFGPP